MVPRAVQNIPGTQVLEIFQRFRYLMEAAGGVVVLFKNSRYKTRAVNDHFVEAFWKQKNIFTNFQLDFYYFDAKGIIIKIILTLIRKLKSLFKTCPRQITSSKKSGKNITLVLTFLLLLSYKSLTHIGILYMI